MVHLSLLEIKITGVICWGALAGFDILTNLYPPMTSKMHCNFLPSTRLVNLRYSDLVMCVRASLIAQSVKGLTAMQETWVQSLGWEDPPEKEMATHSSILAWRIPWTEEPGRLVHGVTRVGHNWATKRAYVSNKIMHLLKYKQTQDVSLTLVNYLIERKHLFKWRSQNTWAVICDLWITWSL